MNVLTRKHIIVSWLLLIVLTLFSVMLSWLNLNQYAFLGAVLFIVFLKGQQIIDIFMELRIAPKKWRILLMSYVVIIPLLLFGIYSI